MLAGFQATLSPILSLFMIMAIGFFLRKKKLVPEDTGTVLSRLETFLLLPALNFNKMLTGCTVETLKTDYRLMLYSLLLVGAAVAMAYLLAPLFEKKDAYMRNIYTYALTFSNYGYMGYAIVPLVFGQEMLQRYILFTLPMNVVLYMWGTTILIPQNGARKNPLLNLINPSFVAIALGMIGGLLGLGKYAPSFLTTTLSSLGNCLGPMAMLLTGFAIGGIEVKKVLGNGKVYIATLLRLIVLPAILISLLFLLKADREVMYIALIAYGVSFGMNTVVFPSAYGGDVVPGSAMAVVSNVLAVITFPLMYGLLNMVLGT